MDVIIPHKPREYQRPFHTSRKRFTVLVWHRGAGKTTATLAELVIRAIAEKGTYSFISPTYKQSKRNAWKILKELVQDMPKTKLVESELRVDLFNGSVVHLLGADNPDSLRGLDYSGVVFDEYSQQPANIFTEIILPRLSISKKQNPNLGWAIWIGTPKGMNSFYDLYEQSKKRFDEIHKDYFVQLLSVEDTLVVDKEELESALQHMTKDEREQEYFCNFNTSVKGAYYANELSDLRTSGRIQEGLYNPMLPVSTFWDIGVHDYTSIVFAQIVGKRVNVIDFYNNHNLGMDHYAEVVRQRGYDYEGHYLPHDAKQRDKTSARSPFDMLRDTLPGYTTITDKLGLKMGIDLTRLMLNNTYFDKSKTQELLNALAQYTQKWDDNLGMYLDSPDHNWASHPADAFRYLGVNYDQLANPPEASGTIIQDFGLDNI